MRKLIFEKDTNTRINRYLIYQFKRMAIANPKEFWILAEIVLTRSKALRLLALRNIKPNWYKDENWKLIYKSLKTLNGIAYRPRETFKVTVTKLEKPNGGHRVIAAPNLASRMYLWILNATLSIYAENMLNQSQHGHRRGKGVGSCWQEILKNLVTYKYIYEFDFIKFHDILDRNFIFTTLLDLDVPRKWASRYTNFLTVYTKKDPSLNPDEDWSRGVYAKTIKGVPQGGNTSAILGILVLEKLKVYSIPGVKYIGYADDGLLGMDDPKLLDLFKLRLNSSMSGVKLKPEKCSWVKFDGEWKSTLKFVGCELVEGKILRARTHSGKTKEMLWPTTRDRIRDFVTNNFMPIPEAKASCQNSPTSKEIKLDWETGWNRFNFLLAKIFGGIDKKPSRMLKWTEESLIAEFPPDLRITKSLPLISTLAFEWLRKLFEVDPELNSRQKKTSSKTAPIVMITEVADPTKPIFRDNPPWVPSLTNRAVPIYKPRACAWKLEPGLYCGTAPPAMWILARG